MERWTHRSLFALLVSLWALELAQQFPAAHGLTRVDWVEPTLLVVALIVTVSSFTRQLPLQNALLAAGIIALVGGAAHWLSYVTGVPLGPVQFPKAAGNTPFQEWFCVPAAFWGVILPNARGVAQLILERRIKPRNHGLQIIGLSALLVVFLALGLEPFASTVHHHWLWGETRLPATWYGVPLSAFLGWGVVSILGLIAATATLIDKHPRPAAPPIDALWLWAMLGGLFGVGNALAGLWAPAAVALANVLLVGILFVAVKRRRR